jgi:hypothetical protein
MRASSVLILLAAAAPQDPATRRAVPPRRGPQEFVPLFVPSWGGERFGASNNALPFGWHRNGPTRYQQFFAAEMFEFEGTLLLAGRGPGQVSAEIEVEITLGTTSEEGICGRFDDNLGDSRVVVLPRTRMTIRSSPDREQTDKELLEIWDVEIPFERSFRYVTNRALVLDIKIFEFGKDHPTFPADSTRMDRKIMRAWGPLDAKEGKTDGTALVVRFDVAARAAGIATRPTSRPR